MGFAKTFSHITDNFYWAGMRQDVNCFIYECPTYQVTKYATQNPSGLLLPIPPPSAR